MTAWAEVLGAAALLALALLALAFATRVRRLGARVGSFECALRPAGQTGWTSGIAVFGAGRLYWHRLVSLSVRPARTFQRRELRLLDRTARGGGVVEVRIHDGDGEVDLAMVDAAHAGLVSWLEAAPPLEGRS